MSSILKALKKAENDQTTTKPKTLPPSSKIKGAGSQATSPAKIMITGLLLFVLGGGTVYYLTKPAAKPRETAPISISSQKNESLNTSKADEPKIKGADPVVPPQIQQTSKPVQAAKPAAIPKHEKADTVKISAGTKQPAQIKPATPPFPSTVEQPLKQPILEVNGIAYQGENGDSIAVINGVSVSKRSVIEGVTVQDIHQDRVTFSKNGKTFDVELGKTSR